MREVANQKKKEKEKKKRKTAKMRQNEKRILLKYSSRVMQRDNVGFNLTKINPPQFEYDEEEAEDGGGGDGGSGGGGGGDDGSVTRQRHTYF